MFLTARADLYDQVEDDLQVRSERLLRPIQGPGFNPRSLNLATVGGYFFIVTGPDGSRTGSSDSAIEIELPGVDSLREQTSSGPAFFDTQTTDGDDLRIYVQRVAENAPDGPYYLQVGRSIEPEQQALQRLVFILVAGGFGGLMLAAAGGFWLSGRALQPIQTAMDAQRTFVADASHELRTPLSLIRANAEVMKRSGGVPEDESIDDIITETDRLSYLVRQMLTLARADSASGLFEQAPVDIAALAKDAARQMQRLADEKRITIAAIESSAAIVTGDEQRLGELLLILLDNAVKYTDEGGSVSVTVTPNESRVSVAIADNGRGIPYEAQPHIFDRFYRADKARSRELGGTGLGLAIARWIAEQHGGTIGVDSTPGTGTTVTVDLPAGA